MLEVREKRSNANVIPGTSVNFYGVKIHSYEAKVPEKNLKRNRLFFHLNKFFLFLQGKCEHRVSNIVVLTNDY